MMPDFEEFVREEMEQYLHDERVQILTDFVNSRRPSSANRAGTLQQIEKNFKWLGGLFGDTEGLHLLATRPDFPAGRPLSTRGKGNIFRVDEILHWVASHLCLHDELYERRPNANEFSARGCVSCLYRNMRSIMREDNPCRCARPDIWCEENYCARSGVALDVLRGVFWRQS